MCRHLAYLGPPVSVAELVLEQPHSLVRQAYAPVDMRGGGTINADGFGVGWYLDGEMPVRYRRAGSIWADAGLPSLLASIRSGAVLAAVRNGTVGLPVMETASAPFTAGRWLFSHNGRLPGWPDTGAKLAERLPITDLLTTDAPTDSALLWALVRQRLRAGAGLADALVETVTDAVAVDPEARLNFLLTDGASLAATTWTHALAVRRTDDSVAVSSEPLDLADPTWHQVPDRHLVVATSTSLSLHPIAEGTP